MGELVRGETAEQNLGPEYAAMSSYFEARFASPHLERNSRYTRELCPGDVNSYQIAMLHTGKAMIDQLGINPELFDDRKCAEGFFLIADSNLVNETQHAANAVSEAEYQAEQQMLFQATRLLARNYSEYNAQQYQAGDDPDGTYFQDENSPKTQRYHQAYELLGQIQDLDESAELAKACAMWGPHTLLAYPREVLGITSPDQEVPYKVVVPKTVARDGLARVMKLLNISGAAAWQGVDPLDGANTIVLPDGRKKDSLIRHEWVHAQREHAINGTALGFFWTEVVPLLVDGGGHVDVDTNYAFLTEFVASQHGQTLDELFRLSLQQDPKTEVFYQNLSDMLGFRSALLSILIPPKGYLRRGYEIDFLPKMNLDERFAQRTEGWQRVGGADPSQLVSGYLLDTVVEEQLSMHGEDYLAEIRSRAEPNDNGLDLWQVVGNSRSTPPGIVLPESLMSIVHYSRAKRDQLHELRRQEREREVAAYRAEELAAYESFGTFYDQEKSRA